MRLKKNNNAVPSPPAPPDDTTREVPGLVWFYGLWVALAAISTWLGHSSIAVQPALFLLGGVISTNFFFTSVAHSERFRGDAMRTLALYQTILGITWTAVYFYFSSGAGDLVLGMYMTVLMFAVFHLTTRALLIMSVAAIGSHVLMLFIKSMASPVMLSPVDDGIRLLVLTAIAAWVYIYARKLRDLRLELQFRNAELENMVDRVTRIAEEDHLTKSFNRRYIMEMLAREKARADRSGRTFTVMLFDLDHFKRVNDRFGHLVGDQILTDFAAHVKQELRGMDSVNTTEHKRQFGRYGGEEFLAVLPGTSARGGELAGERIRKVIARQEFRDNYNITVSIGVAEYRLGETVPQLLSRCDEALYQAKRDGRNRVCVSEPPASEERRTGTQPNLRLLR